MTNLFEPLRCVGANADQGVIVGRGYGSYATNIFVDVLRCNLIIVGESRKGFDLVEALQADAEIA